MVDQMRVPLNWFKWVTLKMEVILTSETYEHLTTTHSRNQKQDILSITIRRTHLPFFTNVLYSSGLWNQPLLTTQITNHMPYRGSYYLVRNVIQPPRHKCEHRVGGKMVQPSVSSDICWPDAVRSFVCRRQMCLFMVLKIYNTNIFPGKGKIIKWQELFSDCDIYIP
jgi:hypothetical protein